LTDTEQNASVLTVVWKRVLINLRVIGSARIQTNLVFISMKSTMRMRKQKLNTPAIRYHKLRASAEFVTKKPPLSPMDPMDPMDPISLIRL